MDYISMNQSYKKLIFSEFFPGDNAFINLKGESEPKDDWFVNLTIQSDVRYTAQFWIAEWNHVEMKRQLLVLQNAINQALTFIELCTNNSHN